MTLPHERLNAVNNTRILLYLLVDPKKTPKVPKQVREIASDLLKHYPTPLDMEMVTEGDGNVFGIREFQSEKTM